MIEPTDPAPTERPQPTSPAFVLLATALAAIVLMAAIVPGKAGAGRGVPARAAIGTRLRARTRSRGVRMA
jgi:hypothetical protein